MKYAFSCLLVQLMICASAAELNPPKLQIPSTKIRGAAGEVEMPMAGLGTWLYNDSVAEIAVKSALKLGARMIDTANTYGNQKGIAKAIAASNVPRKELFILTKVPGGLSTEDTIAAAEQNLKELNVDYVDLLLTHFPCAMTNPPQNCSKAARQATWKGLEEQVKQKKARAIGVSHYCQRQLEDVLEIATVPIALNQEEWHVGMGPDPSGVVSFCKKHQILFQSFSPLCGPCPKNDTSLIDGPLVQKIGKAHGVSGAQVSLRWLVNLGSPVIPKSANPAHIREDLDLFDWKGGDLSEEEMEQLSQAASPASAEPVSADCQFPLEDKALAYV